MIISVPYTFSAGAVIIAAQHNSNFSTIFNDYNGNIDNTNISGSAGIVYSKLNLTGGIVNSDINASAAIAYSKLNLATSIVNADINASAAIADTKLAQITTASKVSGTSITGLASLPAGAGVIPTANLPSSGLSLVSTTTISGAATTGSINITSGNTYFVQFNFVNFSGADYLKIQFNADTSTTYVSGSSGFYYSDSSMTAITSPGSTTGIYPTGTLTIRNTSTDGINGGFYIRQVGTSTNKYIVWGQHYFKYQTVDKDATMDFSGKWDNSSTATSFRIITNSSSTFTGTVYLYQLATS